VIPDPILVLAILPLSLGAGVDLYLTLLFLGAAGMIGWDALPRGPSETSPCRV
jgi:hypothetical protein